MPAPTDSFDATLVRAIDAVDEALDALNTIERPSRDYVLPLLAAQRELGLASLGRVLEVAGDT